MNSNSILIIAPYRYQGQWVFDDANVGLVGDHEAEIRRFAPKAHIIRTLHYAHREAGEVEAAAIANVRHAIGTLPRAL